MIGWRARQDRAAAHAALASSRAGLARVRSKRVAAVVVASRLREARRSNNFGPAFSRYLGGKAA